MFKGEKMGEKKEKRGEKGKKEREKGKRVRTPLFREIGTRSRTYVSMFREGHPELYLSVDL